MADSEKKSSQNNKKNNWEKLLDLQNRLLTLKKGVNGAKVNMGGIGDVSFVNLITLKKALQPLFDEYGWVLIQPITMTSEGKYLLTTKIIDIESGEVFLESNMHLISRDERDPQKWGASITYFRRYSIVSLLNLIGDKDDDCWISDDEAKGHLSSIETVEELTEYYKSFAPERQNFLKPFFTQRREEIQKEKAGGEEKAAEQAAQNAIVEM